MAEMDWDEFLTKGKVKPKSGSKKIRRAVKAIGKKTKRTMKDLSERKKRIEKEKGSLWNVAGEGWIWSSPKKKAGKRRKRAKKKPKYVIVGGKAYVRG